MGASRELWPDENTLFNVLYDKFLFWSILVGIFAFIWLFVAVLRFREGIEPAGKEELKVGTFPKDRHNFKLEMAWFIGPTILVLWVTYLAFGSMNLVWTNMPDPDDSFTIEVNGVQWDWEYRYQDHMTWEDMSSVHDVSWVGDNLTITTSDSTATQAIIEHGLTTEDPLNLTVGSTTVVLGFDETVESKVTIYNAEGETLHRWGHISNTTKHSKNFMMPCDENVTFNLHSDKYGDKNGMYQGVQHAFWLQEWGNKEDVVPGLEGGTWMFVQPNEAGTFPVRCAEYCGERHSVMTGVVEVVAREGMTCDADFGVVFDNKEALE